MIAILHNYCPIIDIITTKYLAIATKKLAKYFSPVFYAFIPFLLTLKSVVSATATST
jgi:hypothetical protein